MTESPVGKLVIFIIIAVLMWYFLPGGSGWGLFGDGDEGTGQAQEGAGSPAGYMVINGQTTLWPPQVGMPYPNLKLTDHNGKKTRLSDFKGKVLIIQPVSMGDPASIAFSGGKEAGAFDGIRPQEKIHPFHTYFSHYARGASLESGNVLFIQIIFSDSKGRAPEPADIKRWATHFGLDKKPNTFILAGSEDLWNQASYNMIPGFQLVDKDFILRYDNTGRSPKHNLFRDIFPNIAGILAE